jgi:DNA-binding NarL/FixJ family response regulator
MKVLIVEDHPMVVEGLKKVLEDNPDTELCGVAGNADACLKHLEENIPDVILLDLMLPGMNGIDLCALITAKYPKVKVLALTTYNQRYYVEKMLNNGAKGYLLKNAGSWEIIEAIQTVFDGRVYLCDEIKRMVNKRTDQTLSLSNREIEVLRLIAEGLTNKEIADKLFISPLTVDSHRKNLIIKLDARNTASLIKIAGEQGFIKF